MLFTNASVSDDLARYGMCGPLQQELDSDMSGAISFDEFTLPEEAPCRQ